MKTEAIAQRPALLPGGSDPGECRSRPRVSGDSFSAMLETIFAMRNRPARITAVPDTVPGKLPGERNSPQEKTLPELIDACAPSDIIFPADREILSGSEPAPSAPDVPAAAGGAAGMELYQVAQCVNNGHHCLRRRRS